MIAIISKFINKLQLSNILLVKLTRFTVDDKFSHQSKQKRSPLITYLIIHLTNKLIHYNEVDSLNNLKEESSDEFLAFGYPCKLFDSRGGRDCADESADLIPLHCNRKILVDRIMSLFGYQMDFIKEFDCRLQLSNLEKYDASKVEQSLLIADRSLEALLDAERYRDFKLTCETPKVENEKRMGTEIYFNYDDLESKPQHGCQPKEEAEGTEDEQKEQFVPPAELKVPVGVTMPKTVKEGIIIEKTAAFIAEQGSQMEIIVNAKQKSNPQFRFLDWNHPLNKYYKHVLKMIKEKRYTPVVVKKDPAPESESDSDDSSEHYLHPSLMGGAGKTAVAKDTEPLSLPKTSYRLGEENDVYSELFNGLVAVCPQLAAAVSTAKGKETGGSAEGLLLPPPPDLYPVVDRVAAYVARNGPQFEQILRERNDPRFSFIDPSNKYNPYYMALLQNYESVPMSLNYLSYYGFVPQPPPPPRSTPPPPAVENQEETLNLKKTKTVYSSDHLTSAAASSSVSEKKPTEMGSVGPVCFTIKAKNQEETCSMVDKANLDAHQDETINLSLQSDSDVLMSDCAEKFDCKFVDGSGDGTESTVKSVDEYMRREITAFPEVGKKEQKNVEEDLNLKRARRYRAKKFVDEFAKKIRKREKSCVDEEKVKKHGHISEGELCDSESSESTLIGPSSNACYGSEKKKKKKKKKEEESKGRLMNFDKLPLSYAKCMKLNERSRSRRRRRSKSSSHSRHRRSTEDRRRRRSRSRKRTSRSRSSRSTTSTRRYYSSRHRRSRSIAKMFVDQPEQLKNWLINTLSPLYHLKLYTKHLVVIEFLCSRCDADPAALAKYVMALLKKDKAEADLKHFCLDQLDVFLQKETKKFVDELFLALKSKVYIVTDKESQSTSTKEVPKKRSLEPSRNEKPSADEHLKSRRVDSHSGSRPVRRYGSSPKARSKSSERSKGKGDATSISQNKASSSTVRDRVKAHWSPSNNKEQRKSTHKDSNEAVGNAENDSVQSIRSEKEKRKKARCRDYDEKGYCMLGDNCVYDHGPDPVVVEDVALSSMIPMKDGTGRSNKSLPTPPPNFSVPPPGYVPIPPPPPGVDSNFQTEGYNPEAPSLTSASTGTAVPLPPPYTQPPPPIWAQPPPVLRPFGPRQIASYAQLRVSFPRARQLITLSEDRTNFDNFSQSTIRTQHKSVGQINLRKRAAVDQINRQNRTLEVRRIPQPLNTITKLNEHFSQFGHITNIEVCYEGDPQAALITYMTRPQALAAYKSTDPILNNRFIRVFWHNQKDGTAVDDTGTSDQSSRPARIPIRDRLELPVKSSSNGTSSHEEAIFKAETNATAANAGSDTVSTTMNKNLQMDGDAFATKSVRLVHNADAEVKNPVANVAASKGENTKRILKKRLELQRAETELFNRQLEQEKLLLKKLEDCKDQTTKELIIKTLKKLEISLMATKKNLESRDFSKFVKRSKTEVQRDVLDAELELITKKKAGEDITEIAVRLQNLRKEMQHLNDTESNNKHCRNSAYRPERNRRIPRSAVLDLRSRSILITDFCMEHKDALIEHLQQFGTLRDIDFYPLTDPAVGKVIASFYDRKEAERAFTDGKLFKDQLLNMTWAVEDKDAMAAALSAGSKSDLSAKALLKTLDPPDDDDDDDDDLFEENEREEVEEEEQQLA
ncbi:RNA-binding protein 26 [Trichinella spiralis]|uniref:RNA-binding protein 26 n=1 Tax=Trichinella spiralis TaxID=6334 RepID=A0A0V1B787_TRISP|nr:RNA-binding protein 26 [Trichinella spiralis]